MAKINSDCLRGGRGLEKSSFSGPIELGNFVKITEYLAKAYWKSFTFRINAEN